MTTSDKTEDLNHPAIRRLVDEANALSLVDRLTLLKGLIPGVARELSPKDFESLVLELRLKGERFYDAEMHPGQGRAARHVIGEGGRAARGLGLLLGGAAHLRDATRRVVAQVGRARFRR